MSVGTRVQVLELIWISHSSSISCSMRSWIGGILREETVPEHASAGHRHRAKQLRDGRRRQQALGAELRPREQLEVTAEHFDRADLQSRDAGPQGQLPQLVEVEVLG